jgi:hypothetical protein
MTIDVSSIALPLITTKDQFDVYIADAGQRSQRIESLASNGITFDSGKLRLMLSAKTLTHRSKVLVVIQLTDEFAQSKFVLDNISNFVRDQIAYEKPAGDRHLFVSGFGSSPAGGGVETNVNPILYKGDPVWGKNSFINQILLEAKLNAVNLQRGSISLDSGLVFRKMIPLNLEWIRTFSQGERKNGKRSGGFAKAYEEEAQELNATFANPGKSRLDKSKIVASFHNFLVSKYGALVAQYRERFAKGNGPYFKDLSIDWFSPKLEIGGGSVFKSRVANLLSQSSFALHSREGQVARNLFVIADIMPVGIEVGRRLRGTTLNKSRAIARLTSSADVLLRFRFPCRDDIFADRLEFETKFTERHLLRSEMDPANASKLVTGNKYYVRSDLRYVLGFRVPIPYLHMKPAFVLSYVNGYNPPIFNYVHGFKFQFTLVSDDKRSTNDTNTSVVHLFD